MIFDQLINNVALLLALSIVHNFILRFCKRKTETVHILTGLVFGGVAVVLMMNPLTLYPGIVFDSRSVVLSTVGVFGGAIGTSIAVVVAAAYRIWMGGGGVYMGIGVIVTSGLVGVLYNRIFRLNATPIRPFHFYSLGFIVHILMLLWMLALPWAVLPEVLSKISLPVLIIFPLANLLLGFLLAEQESRFHTEHQLKESEQRFRELCENMSEVFWIASVEDRRILYVNPASETLWGRSCRDLNANLKIWMDRIHPEDRDRIAQSMDEGLKKQIPFSHEYRVVGADGGVRWVFERVCPVLNADHQVYRIAGVSEDVTARKRAMNERDRFFNLSIDMLCIAGFDGFFKQINPAWKKTLGWSEDEMIQKPWIEFVHPDDRPATISVGQRLFSGEVVLAFENRYQCKDGSYRWLLWDAMPTLDENLIYSAVHDITDRKTMENALRKSEAQFRAIADSSPFGIILLQPDGHVIYGNAAYLRMSGLSWEEAQGMSWVKAIFPEDLDRVETEWNQAFQNHRCYSGMGRYLHSDGTVVWWDIQTAEIRDGDSVLGYVGMVEDISERKKMIDALMSSEKRYRELVQNVNSIILRIDTKGIITFINEFAQQFFGYPEEEILGRCVLGTIIPETDTSGQNLMVMLDDLLHHPEKYTRHENENITRDGCRVWIVWSNRPIYDSHGSLVEIFCVGNDNTERKRLEQQLAQAQKMESIGRLAGGIAHDFNNLLMVIKGYSEFALQKLDPTNPIYKDIEEVSKAGDRASSLTRQLLAFSRKQILQPKVLNLNQAILDLDNMLRRLIGEDIELVIAPDPSLNLIEADPGQIEQIIMNLTVNARDAMPQGGKVIIQTGNVTLDDSYIQDHPDVLPGVYAMMAISDTGCGMDKNTVSNIFDPFFTTKEQGKGTGLGLATVYGIVKQSGGHIGVLSELGKGTTFQVYFPWTDKAEEGEESASSFQRVLQGTETILLVEDESIVRNIVHKILENAGYTVWVASYADEALNLYEKHKDTISLVITDVIMPGMSGREMVQRLVAMQPQIKVIFMSGYTNESVIQQDILEHGLVFLQKPVATFELLKKVREILDNSILDH